MAAPHHWDGTLPRQRGQQYDRRRLFRSPHPVPVPSPALPHAQCRAPPRSAAATPGRGPRRTPRRRPADGGRTTRPLDGARREFSEVAHRDRPIGVVAGRRGLSAPSYCSRLFRQAFGLSPRDWRHSSAHATATPSWWVQVPRLRRRRRRRPLQVLGSRHASRADHPLRRPRGPGRRRPARPHARRRPAALRGQLRRRQLRRHPPDRELLPRPAAAAADPGRGVRRHARSAAASGWSGCSTAAATPRRSPRTTSSPGRCPTA